MRKKKGIIMIVLLALILVIVIVSAVYMQRYLGDYGFAREVSPAEAFRRL